MQVFRLSLAEAQTSHAYLSQIASTNGLRLVRFDTSIPGAVQI